MTQQYIRGELSPRLGGLCEGRCCFKVLLLALRHQVETAPPGALPELAVKALDVVDAACWSSLTSGDLATFDWECREMASLHEFAVCAGLLP